MKKILIVVIGATLSGCFYIGQNWDMYDAEHKTKNVSVDAGTD